jgi:hypothetical protein
MGGHRGIGHRVGHESGFSHGISHATAQVGAAATAAATTCSADARAMLFPQAMLISRAGSSDSAVCFRAAAFPAATHAGGAGANPGADKPDKSPSVRRLHAALADSGNRKNTPSECGRFATDTNPAPVNVWERSGLFAIWPDKSGQCSGGFEKSHLRPVFKTLCMQFKYSPSFISRSPVMV